MTQITSIDIADMLGISHRKALSHIKTCFKIKENQQKEDFISWQRVRIRTKYIDIAILEPKAMQALARYYDHNSEMLARAAIRLKGSK